MLPNGLAIYHLSLYPESVSDIEKFRIHIDWRRTDLENTTGDMELTDSVDLSAPVNSTGI